MRAEPLLSRRMALAGSGAGVLVTGMMPLSPAGAAARAKHDDDIQRQLRRILVGRSSGNGWPMEKGADIGGSIWTRPVPGTGGTAAIRLGDVEAVLMRIARRFHYEVVQLEPGDILGYRTYRGVGRGIESNHASGTAIDLLPGGLPSGVRNLTADQADRVRTIVGDCGDVVAWGGENVVPAESHFQIAVGPGDVRLAELAMRIRAEEELPPSVVGVTL